jgi:NTE family protein
LLAAQKIAYVFSGGSSRCAFQIGAIERLAALGVKPAVCIGASGGAWNAAIVAARCEHRIRFLWKSFMRMRAHEVDLSNLFVELSPWRYAELNRRIFSRFIGDRLSAPDALPCHISVTRLRDRDNVMIEARDLEDPVDLIIASNYFPPFYTRAPRILGERYGDGGASNNIPYDLALDLGCDAIVVMTMKGESEGGIHKSTIDFDHEIPASVRDRIVMIRPRHRLPYAFMERRWDKLVELIALGDLRTREVVLGERHPETDIRAEGDAPSMRITRLWRRLVT